MKHIRDIPFDDLGDSARLRRTRLFELCRQQHRAATSAAASADQAEVQLSDDILDEIRARAVRSLARPA